MSTSATTDEKPISASTSASAWVVEADRAVQRYYDTRVRRDRTILNEIEFRMRPGEFCSVVGPSGCGKSTFLRLVLGCERPKAGRVRVFGREPKAPDRNRGIVYQRYSLFPNMRVLDNVAFGLELDEVNFLMKWINYPSYRKQRKIFEAKAMHFLETIGLAEHADKYPHQLSGGQQQRVAIAQALITNPSILLMDEPFGALDPGTREELQRWLLEIQAKEGTSIFFVTHDLEEAVFLSSRVVVLSPHYTLMDNPNPEGAKIVADIGIPNISKDDWLHAPEFRETVDHILDTGFHEDTKLDPANFVRSHSDSVPPRI